MIVHSRTVIVVEYAVNEDVEREPFWAALADQIVSLNPRFRGIKFRV
jgi:hypothetical protein